MIRAFVDDSSDGNVSLLAGWVADYAEWERFSQRWIEVLKERPKIDYFRHHEAKTDPPTGQFENWTKEQIESKMTKLVEVICEHEMYGAVVGLKLDTHWKAFGSSVLSRKQLQSVLKLVYPYHFCFFAFTASVLQIERERGNHDRRVDFIFDEQGQLLKTCVEVYREFKAIFPEELKDLAGVVSEADDKHVAALQAADLLVGQMVTQFRLPQPEAFFQKMVTCHKVFSSTAYVPKFETIPDIISELNVTWSTKRIAGVKEKKKQKNKGTK
jgi:hypothetical protein